MPLFTGIIGDTPESPHELPLMSLREVVMFPRAIIPLFVGRDASIKAIENAVARYDKHIFLVTQKAADIEKPGPGDLYSVGVVSKILQLLRLPDGSVKVLFEGLYRAVWHPLTQEDPFGGGVFPRLMIEALAEFEGGNSEREALVRATHEALDEFGKLNRKINPEQLASLSGLREPGRLADAVMALLRLEHALKQEVLEILDGDKRLEKVFEILSGELSVVSLEKTIKNRVRGQMERNQREYYLNEQIKAIHKEMGREDDPQAEAAELELRFKEKNMPEEAREKALREVRRLRQMAPASAEYTVARNYIDWLLDLPWNDLKPVEVGIQEAKGLLDSGHFGLEKPKERILEYLAVQKLAGKLKGPILCLVGPPGVGKTSLAKSVAKATGREFVRVSLGGVRDEAEIRGHRRTYVGALPGKIISALKRVKYNNPLFCLDEIDKMTSDFRGDPSSALLEVLDPEQNSSFDDHYLDMGYDLSQVFFITTANSLAGIPAPLMDRMEIIHLSSYLEIEKIRIARDFLLPRQLEMHGLKPENLRISENALMDLIRFYTRESGVRSLERQIAALCRKAAMRMAEAADMEKSAAPAMTGINVSTQNLHTFLGVKKYRFEERESAPLVGVVAGLAFNDRGGEILYIESAVMPGSGKVSSTGHLGDVMKESAQAAFSYVRSRSGRFGLKPDFHKDIDLHVHVPEGATPKDGPSAGITLATSMVSALLGIPVRNDVAMTGEITLRGRVLPIGGLREKLLAARRAGMKTVIMPADNERDLKEVPEEILKSLKLVFVRDVDEVLPVALEAAGEDIFSGTDSDGSIARSLRAGVEMHDAPEQ